MDATATRRFLASNVTWPLDKFFIPAGGLLEFLHLNLRFKVFLIMSCLFTDVFAGITVPSLTQEQMMDLRHRMRDIVSHVSRLMGMEKFFAAQIRQNEFRASYKGTRVPAQAAWMFHMILTLLHIVGFEGDDVTVVSNEPSEVRRAEGEIARAQTSFLLGAALATFVEETKSGIPSVLEYPDYDKDEHVSKHFARHCHPTHLSRIPVREHRVDAYELSEILSGWHQAADIASGEMNFPRTVEAEISVAQAEAMGITALVGRSSEEPRERSVSRASNNRRCRIQRGRNIYTPSPERRPNRDRVSASRTMLDDVLGGRISGKFLVPVPEDMVMRADGGGSSVSLSLVRIPIFSGKIWYLNDGIVLAAMIPVLLLKGRRRVRRNWPQKHALFILEACSWSPGDKTRPPSIPQDEELAIRDWLSALHGSLAIAGVFRSRALVRLADIPQEKRLGSDDVYRYSLFGQATHIFEIFREISYRFPPITRSEDAARRRAWFHMEEMELVCRSIADVTGGERDFPEYDAGGYYRGFRDSFEFPFAFLDRIGERDFTSMAPNSPLPVSLVKPAFLSHLLDASQLADPTWVPSSSISDFIREKIRIMVYLLQRVTFEEAGVPGLMVLLSEPEQAEMRLLIRHLLTTLRSVGRARKMASLQLAMQGGYSLATAPLVNRFAIPAQATRCFEIFVIIMARYPPSLPDEKVIFALMMPVVNEMLVTARSVAEASGAPKDFPEFGPRRQYLQHRGFHGRGPSPIHGSWIIDMPSKGLDRFPIRAEFQNLDFRSHRELFEFSCHPFMRKVTDEFLEPMAQFFPLIHSEYAADPSSKTERETSTIRQHIRSYMDHVEQISDIIVRYHDLAAACRIPCPGAAWLHVVMEAEALYGFEGDEDPLSKVIMKGKLFSAYRYSRKIHQNAVDRMCIGDGPFPDSPDSRRLVNDGKEEGEEYAAIPQCLLDALQAQAGFRRDPAQYSHSADGLVHYVCDIRGFGEALCRCIPRSVRSVEQFPVGRREHLTPYVVEFVSQVALIYDIMFAWAKGSNTPPFVDPRAIKILRMAEDFDRRFGRPSKGYVPNREEFTSRVIFCLRTAVQTQRLDDADDVPLVPHIAALPVVPSWSLDRINELKVIEQSDPYIAATTRMLEDLENSQGLIYQVQKEAGYRSQGYGPFLHFPRMIIIGKLAKTSLRYTENDLEVLWIHRCRHLAQSILHVAALAELDTIPAVLLDCVRRSVRVVMDNAIFLARASVEYGPYKRVHIPKFFVPGECTVLLRLIEGFVDIFGFEGDGNDAARAVIFENMETLYGCMILNPRYSFCEIDFPVFRLSADLLERFGIWDGIKASQLSRPLLSGGVMRHLFGQDLLRYNPSLGEEGRYKIGLEREELAPTRPNTPSSDELGMADVVEEPICDDASGKLGPADFSADFPEEDLSLDDNTSSNSHVIA
ncbi:hypothetical protein B0H11DRAFT_1929113 [Mycena galericulata]|nr:hypothetical protein B0H11DRAFT_1929113 [Mycena galericulata]